MCGGAAIVGTARCFALVRTDVGGRPPKINPLRHRGDAVQGHAISVLSGGAGGYGPDDIQSAYNLPSWTNGSGQTVAVVDAYDDPNAESDLAQYRSYFNLPACTSSNGCFRKVDQNGGANYPSGDSSWGGEISVDVDMVSATCPNCSILLVEANSASTSDLDSAENTAASLGAAVISNSFGGGEMASDDSAFNHPGVVITASVGDSGTGSQAPCAYAEVVCVGGTSLNYSSSNGFSETAWSGTGSGCSAYVAKPSWQTDSGCGMRSEADIAAVADPDTGVAFYDTYGSGGWGVAGGTSVSSPIIASVFALAGNTSSVDAASGIWNDAGANTNAVTSGSNGSCSVWYICNDGVGYGGPTGWGTPNGLGAFGGNATSTPTPVQSAAPTPSECYAAWDPSIAYSGGAQVSYAGVNYAADYWTQGQEPDLNDGPAGSGQPWISDGSCSDSSAPETTPTPNGIQVFNPYWQ